MWTSDLWPIGQAHRWWPGFLIGFWSGGSFEGLSSSLVGSEAISGHPSSVWELLSGMGNTSLPYILIGYQNLSQDNLHSKNLPCHTLGTPAFLSMCAVLDIIFKKERGSRWDKISYELIIIEVGYMQTCVIKLFCPLLCLIFPWDKVTKKAGVGEFGCMHYWTPSRWQAHDQPTMWFLYGRPGEAGKAVSVPQPRYRDGFRLALSSWW